MRLSAKQIGDKHGLTSREVNQLLKRQGFLKGEPNNWCPTEKAEPYIHETDYKRGTGGYKQYNPSDIFCKEVQTASVRSGTLS